MAERVVPGRPAPTGPAELDAEGSPSEATPYGPAQAGPPGFGNTTAGSAVEWNVPEAKMFFNDLATDKPLPKNLITGTSAAGTA